MIRAVEQAYRGRGHVSPNPCVGCVIVKHGRVISEGYHEKFGEPHAEINALKRAGAQAKGATVYLTLEPCTHWGKTPPCAPQLIQAGVRKVIVGVLDPNPQVRGRGIRALKKSGISVEVGVEKAACESLMRAYLTWRRKGRPFVVLKMAMTLDGKIAAKTGDSRWITNPTSRKLVHQMRTETDAILVGAGTVLRDNPSLTSHGKGRNPIRIVLDPLFQTSVKSRIFQGHSAPTCLFVHKENPSTERILRNRGVRIIKFPYKNGAFNLKTILRFLSKNNVSQLLIEGGGETSWAFIKEKMVDELWFFIAPKIAGGARSITPVEGVGVPRIAAAIPLGPLSVERCGRDLLVRARVEKQHVHRHR